MPQPLTIEETRQRTEHIMLAMNLGACDRPTYAQLVAYCVSYQEEIAELEREIEALSKGRPAKTLQKIYKELRKGDNPHAE